MTEFAPGDAVVVNSGYSLYGRTEAWNPDTVKRVTAASVITESNGAFRLKSSWDNASLVRRGQDGYTHTLRRADDPRVLSAVEQKAARSRQQMRDKAIRSDAIFTWVQQGTGEGLTAAIAALTEAQAQHGEPL